MADKGLKIIALEAENLKRLTAVEIRPDGNLVQITGKNGQGKTSILDAIWWCIAGSKNIQSTPIRHGETQALVKLDLGEIKITRRFRAADNGEYTTSLTVENGEGARFQSPQKMLDNLFGELSFDPLVFLRMKPVEQIAAFRSLVPDFDFDANDKLAADAYDTRRDVNRDLKQLEAEIVGLREGLPDSKPKRVDVSAAMDELDEVQARNMKRQMAARRLEDLNNNKANANERIAKLKDEIASIESQLQNVNDEIAGIGQINADEPTDHLRDTIDGASNANELVDQFERVERLEGAAAEKRILSDGLTQQIEKRKALAKQAIADAELPFEGIEIGDEQVFLRGVPFEQASDAEQLAASIGIAMALNPKLKVIRVRDGSLLDDEAMQQLAKIADEADYQVWIERVDSSGQIGFVIEDGHLKDTSESEDVPQAA